MNSINCSYVSGTLYISVSKFTAVPQVAGAAIVAVGVSLVAVAIIVPLILYYRYFDLLNFANYSGTVNKML